MNVVCVCVCVVYVCVCVRVLVCVCVCVCVCVHACVCVLVVFVLARGERAGRWAGDHLIRFQEGRRNLQPTSGEDDGLSPKLEDLPLCAVVAALFGNWSTGGRHLETFVVFQDIHFICARALKKMTFRRFFDFWIILVATTFIRKTNSRTVRMNETNNCWWVECKLCILSCARYESIMSNLPYAFNLPWLVS